MRLILTRHGETEENKAKIMQGHLPGKLSKLGKQQARKLAQRLKGERIDVIYSSDLARAVDTTKAISRFQKAKVVYSKFLRERYLGSAQGRTSEQVDWKKVDDAEPLEDLYLRAKVFLDQMLEMHPDQTVLVVAHGGINSNIEAAITGQDPKIAFEQSKMGNTAVSIFEITQDRKHHIHLLNCSKHLDQKVL